MYTHCVILTWRSWWKTPVFVLEPPQLPCLQGDVTQREEMNWVNPTHRVGLTKQRQDEWRFTVATVWPASLMISREQENFFLKPQNRVSDSCFLVHLGPRCGPTIVLICAVFWFYTTGAERTWSNDECAIKNVSRLVREHRILARRQPCWPMT